MSHWGGTEPSPGTGCAPTSDLPAPTDVSGDLPHGALRQSGRPGYPLVVAAVWEETETVGEAAREEDRPRPFPSVHTPRPGVLPPSRPPAPDACGAGRGSSRGVRGVGRQGDPVPDSGGAGLRPGRPARRVPARQGAPDPEGSVLSCFREITSKRHFLAPRAAWDPYPPRFARVCAGPRRRLSTPLDLAPAQRSSGTGTRPRPRARFPGAPKST